MFRSRPAIERTVRRMPQVVIGRASGMLGRDSAPPPGRTSSGCHCHRKDAGHFLKPGRLVRFDPPKPESEKLLAIYSLSGLPEFSSTSPEQRIGQRHI